MLTVQQIIDRARTKGYISANQYTDLQALQDFNIVRKKLGKIFVQRIDEDFFFDILRQDSVDGQTEYGLRDETNNITIDKVKSVFVKYDSTATDYTPVKEVYTDELTKDLSWYATNQPTTSPIYHISDESMFIYPATTAVTDGIKSRVTLKLTDLAIDAGADDVLMDCDDLIVDGMLPYIYQQRGLLNEKNDAKANFEDNIEEYIEIMSERVSKTSETEEPEDLEYYA